MTIGGVLSDGFSIYRRLIGRSVVVAGIVFVFVSLGDAFAAESGTASAQLVSLILDLTGGLLVTGALVEVVRDLHEGKPAAPVQQYFDRTRGRLGTLLGTTILYGIGVLFGFLLLIVPGLIAVARWSLVVPVVMVEQRGWRDAFARSSELVKGQTGRVLVLIIITNLILSMASIALVTAFMPLPEFWSVWIGGTIAGALVVPLESHVIIALYYRLTEPDRPVLPDESQRTSWQSVWDEERE